MKPKINTMTLVRRSPLFAGFPTWLDEFFDAPATPAQPAVRSAAANVSESEHAYSIELLAPGFDKSDFELSVQEQVLTLKAEHKKESEEKNDRYTRREFAVRSFSRSFHLPKNVDSEHIEARYENGVLMLELPKLSKPVPVGKAIEVK